MNDLELEQTILDFVARSDYRPMKPRAIANHLHVPQDQAAIVKRAVKRLVHRGQLQYGGNHLVRGIEAGKTRSGRIVGVFQRTSKGYGFVRPHGLDASGTEVQDIYIPAKRASDASSGDTVLVQLLKRRRGEPGPRGEIIEITDRETHQFVGTYFESQGAGYVQVDGTLFAQPIHVGDPGAKNARTDDKVVFEMVRFPSPFHDGEGVITEVLGPQGKPGVDTLLIIRECNLPEAFADDALEEARLEADRFDESIPVGRLDLSGETVVTIDPEDARDSDDAISLTKLDNGHWRLGVHIADVTHFVRPDTALD